MWPVLAGCLAGAVPVQAQDLTYRHFERAARERTTTGRERSAMQPWIRAAAALRIDSVSDTRIFAGNAAGPGDRVVIEVTPDRRVVSLTPQADRRQTRLERPPMSPEDSLSRDRARFVGAARTMRLPEYDLRWLALRFGPVPAAGAPVTDTVVFSARHAEFADSVTLVRRRTATGDTLVDGRRLLIVRDSALVREWATWPIRLRSMGADEVRVRTLAGTLRGTSLMDPELGIAVVAHDTLRLEGELRVALPDGRVFATTVTVERVEHITSHAPGEWAQLQAARATPYVGGMVRVPEPAELARLEQARRLSADSLVALWLHAPDFAGRTEVYRTIQGAFPDAWPEWIPRLRVAALAAGDTAAALDLHLGAGGMVVPVDTALWSLVRPLLDDPGLALDLGTAPDAFYNPVIDVFLRRAHGLAAAGAGGACEPAACTRMAAEATRATEPRLRDFGRITRLALSADPADADRVLARVAEGSAMAARIVPLLRGAATPWMVGERPPVPEPGADWREWLVWSGTRPPEARIEQWYRARGVTFEGPFRFDDSHAGVLRFHARLTGRDYVNEFTRAAASAASDSARLVYGIMRVGLGAALPPANEIAAHVISDSATVRALGHRELDAFFAPNAVAADEATAVEALNGLLSLLLDRTGPWRFGDDVDPRHVRLAHAVEGPMVLVSDSVPQAVVERWRGRIEPVRSGDLDGRDLHAALNILQPRAVRAAGPFVDVTVDYQSRNAVPPEAPPEIYAGSITLRIVRRPDGWVVVSLGAEMT